MADETMTKKVTDLTESTEPTDEDLFLAGSAGTASLRKIKWSNIWTKITSSILNKLVANNLITTAAGFLLDARQGKVLDDKLTELNTNMSKVPTLDTASMVINTIEIGYCPSSTQELISTTLPNGYSSYNTYVLGVRVNRQEDRIAYVDSSKVGTTYLEHDTICFVPTDFGVTYCAGQRVTAIFCAVS